MTRTSSAFAALGALGSMLKGTLNRALGSEAYIPVRRGMGSSGNCAGCMQLILHAPFFALIGQ